MLRSTISENYNENIKRKMEMQHPATKQSTTEINQNQDTIKTQKPADSLVVAEMNLSETLLSKFCY